MANDKQRKEVHLLPLVINELQKLADKKGWSLKKYMETVLNAQAAKAK